MQKHHLLALASLLAVSTAWAEDRPAPPAPPSFSSLDSNGDGEISSSEAANDPMLSQMFDKLDANGDGVISEDEYRAPPPPRR